MNQLHDHLKMSKSFKIICDLNNNCYMVFLILSRTIHDMWGFFLCVICSFLSTLIAFRFGTLFRSICQVWSFWWIRRPCLTLLDLRLPTISIDLRLWYFINRKFPKTGVHLHIRFFLYLYDDLVTTLRCKLHHLCNYKSRIHVSDLIKNFQYSYLLMHIWYFPDPRWYRVWHCLQKRSL